jgi:hypothetical protein
MTFFHAHANTLLSEGDKATAIFDLFNEVLASPLAHLRRIKFEALGLPSLDMLAMGARFTEEEVSTVIKALLLDKAPNPDGFMTWFFHVAWPVIRYDVMMAFNAFWRMDTRHQHNTNDALMVLSPKTADAKTIKDYRPIALIHSVAKVLVNRLAPKL